MSMTLQSHAKILRNTNNIYILLHVKVNKSTPHTGRTVAAAADACR